jgi:aldehyde:ferredoxin oxidoreductase
VIDSLVLCDWLYPMFIGQGRQDRMGDTAAESKLLSAVTGIEYSEKELDCIGERIWNLQRAIMVREGRTRKEDTLHESYFRKGNIERRKKDEMRDHTNVTSDQTKPIPRRTFEKAKEAYYKIRGWDEKTGYPTRENLINLGLDEIAEQLSPWIKTS